MSIFDKAKRLFTSWDLLLILLMLFACFDSTAFSLYLLYSGQLNRDLYFVAGIFFFIGLLTFSTWLVITRKMRRHKTDTAKLQDLEYDKQVIDKELEIARGIQKALYPRRDDFSHPKFDVFGFSIATDRISGDYFDFFLNKEKVYFGIGDVTGHGLSSFIVSVLANRKFRAYVKLGVVSFSRIMEEINVDIQAEGSKHMSILLGHIDEVDTIHLYGRQESLIVCRADAIEIHDITESGFMLGISSFDRKRIPYFSLTLEPGDFLIMYTDGLTEVENGSKEPLGLNRVVQYIDTNKDRLRVKDAQRIAQSCIKFAAGWKEEDFEDDITLLVIKRR